jgi:hypothetical protein
MIHEHESEPLLQLAVERYDPSTRFLCWCRFSCQIDTTLQGMLSTIACGREVDNKVHESELYDAVGLHLPGESHQQSLFGYLRKSGYGAARRAINAQVLSSVQVAASGTNKSV